MLISHIKQKRIYGGEEVSKALKMYYSWLSGDELFNQVYIKLYELLDNSIRLSRALIDRNYRQVAEIVDKKILIFC